MKNRRNTSELELKFWRRKSEKTYGPNSFRNNMFLINFVFKNQCHTIESELKFRHWKFEKIFGVM